MTCSKRRPLGIAVAMALVLSAGCGRSDWGFVSGQVTVDGKPVGPGTLVFEPSDKDRNNHPSSLGYFDESGRYELLSAGNEKGAPAGEYRVLIMEGGPASLADEGAAANVSNTQIPPRYGDYAAGLTASVKPGRQELDFSLAKQATPN